MKKLLLVTTALIFGGCEYIELTEHKIKTVDGKVITLLCPEIDPHRSTFTYLIVHECRIIKD